MRKILDVSTHNGAIDWAKVRGHVDAVIIRCGYGDNITSQDDKRFGYNAQRCEELGIPYGVYLYSYASTLAQANSEADHVIRLLSGRKLSLPVFFDSEEKGTERAAAGCCDIFCEKVRSAGYDVGIYASESWFNSYLKGKIDDNLPRWIAKYSASKPRVEDVWAWQYTPAGSVPGITGRVDLSYILDETRLAPSQIPQASAHIQLNYAAGSTYRLNNTMNIRSSAGSASKANITGKTLKKGTLVKNLATTRVGDEIWMYIGSGWLRGRYIEKWICADTGSVCYAQEI